MVCGLEGGGGEEGTRSMVAAGCLDVPELVVEVIDVDALCLPPGGASVMPVGGHQGARAFRRSFPKILQRSLMASYWILPYRPPELIQSTW